VGGREEDGEERKYEYKERERERGERMERIKERG
jgi:hypothetical protein